MQRMLSHCKKITKHFSVFLLSFLLVMGAAVLPAPVASFAADSSVGALVPWRTGSTSGLPSSSDVILAGTYDPDGVGRPFYLCAVGSKYGISSYDKGPFNVFAAAYPISSGYEVLAWSYDERFLTSVGYDGYKVNVSGSSYVSDPDSSSRSLLRSSVWAGGISPQSSYTSGPHTVYYGYGLSMDTPTAVALPLYESRDAALSAAASWDGSTGSVVSYSIPVGYAAYFKGSGSLALSTTFTELSSSSGDWYPVTQKYSTGLSLPSGSTHFPLEGSLSLSWRASGSLDPLGRGYYATTNVLMSNSGYTCIYNPVFRQYGQGNNYFSNSAISFTGKISDIKLYKLSGSVVAGEGITSTAPVDPSSDPSSVLSGTINEDGSLTFTDGTGETAVPVAGGYNSLPGSESITDILQNFVRSFKLVFEAPIEAIRSLIGSASSFMSALGGLWVWLPAPVSSLLSSALVVMVALAVIRLLFK